MPALSYARSSRSAVSADGRYVAFLSDAGGIEGDTRGHLCVYVKDRTTGTLELTSKSTGGVSPNADVSAFALSSDGRYVAFITEATNLASLPAQIAAVPLAHVYLRDRSAGVTTLVDTLPNGAPSSIASATHVAVSANGPVVVYGLLNGSGLGGGTTIDLVARNMQSGVVEPVSVSSAGVPGDRGAASSVVITPDARYVAFDSVSDNLVPGDTNNALDVFVRDRQLQSTERASLSSTGAQLPSGGLDPHLSGNGQVVVFRSTDSALASDGSWLDYFARDRQTGAVMSLFTSETGFPGPVFAQAAALSDDGRYAVFSAPTSGVSGGNQPGEAIYLRDRISNTIIQVSQPSPSDNSFSTQPSINSDGSLVTYTSDSASLVSGDTNNRTDVFLWHRQAGDATRISTAADGSQLTRRAIASQAAVSANGEFVAFQSDAFNLTPGNTHGSVGMFVWTRRSGAVERVDLSASGELLLSLPTDEATDVFRGPSITPDGRFVVFCVAGTLYVRDRSAGITEVASLAPDGSPANDLSFCGGQAISADGRYLVFKSAASNLVPGDTNQFIDVFVRDRQNRTTTRVNLAQDGSQSNRRDDYFHQASISADGTAVAFSSFATNLTPGDTNGLEDVFVRDLVAGITRRVSVRSDGGQTVANPGFLPTGSHTPALSADAHYVAFISNAANLDPAAPVHTDNTFVRDMASGATQLVSYLPDGSVADNVPLQAGASLAGFSGDGRYVLFQAQAAAFTPGYSFPDVVVLLRDRTIGVTTVVSDSDGSRFWDTNRAEGHVGALSPDGRWAGFAAGPDASAAAAYHPLDVYLRRTATPPLAPTGLTATAVSPRQVQLQWTNPDPLTTAFHIERRTDAVDWSPLATVGGAATSYLDSSVQPLTHYTYRVYASDDLGNSEYSNEAMASTPVELPDPPVIVSAAQVSPGRITLTWTEASPNVTQFWVERSEPGVDFGPVAEPDGVTHTYSDSGLAVGVVYRYRVIAFNDHGPSSPSAEVVVDTRLPAPAAPHLTSATAADPNTVYLTWSEAGTVATSFRVERRSGGSDYALVGSAAPAATSFDDTGCSPNVTYVYRIRAENGDSVSSYSNELSVTTPTGLPPAPTALSASAPADTQVHLTWTASDAETDFRVERKTGAGSFVEIASLDNGRRDYADNTVTGGLTYTYRVRAHNQFGFSPYTAEISVTTPASASGVAVLPATLTFPAAHLRHTTTATLTIRNSDRKHPLRITVTAPALPFRLLDSGGPLLIPGGGSVKLRLSFMPTSKGKSNGTLAVTTSEVRHPTRPVHLVGKGLL